MDIPYEEFWELIKNNNPFVHEGECNRCGKCCYWKGSTKLPDGSNDPNSPRFPCPHLSFDKEGLAVCNIYGTDEYPEECAAFPMFPFTEMDAEEYYKDCTMRAVVDESLSRTEFYEKLNVKCQYCSKGYTGTYCINQQAIFPSIIERTECEFAGLDLSKTKIDIQTELDSLCNKCIANHMDTPCELRQNYLKCINQINIEEK